MHHRDETPGTELVVDPTTDTIERRPGSARRTSHIDIIGVGASMMLDGFRLVGRSRDVLTVASGHGDIVAQATIGADIGPMRLLKSLTSTPALDRIDDLVGRAVAGGFRAAVDAVAGDHVEDHTPLHTLLDDLPVAALIAGYADLYTRNEEMHADGQGRGLQADICAGWQAEGTMLSAIAADGKIPVPVGPEAPTLERADDPLSWHEMDELPIGAMRRRRLVDVCFGDEVAEIRAMFRDTHVDGDGLQTVLHEYQLAATVDPATLVVLSSAATPRVLPWIECPQAVESAQRIAGHEVGTLRSFVGRELRGVSTCTHLNDLLRSIDDVAPLLRLQPR